MELEGIYKDFDEVKVLQNLNLTINKKEITCILGPSGCGKSTLLNIMAGIIKPDQGMVRGNNQRIGYVFQEDRLLPWQTVYQNIRLVNKKASTQRIMELIELVGLKNFEHKFPAQLSGGMRQRCSIARGFNYEAQLLLMDEPFKSLDYDLRINMVNSLIEIWQKWDNSVIFVTHEIDEAVLLGDRIIVLTKNPCTVDGELTINIPQSHRQLADRELIGVRTKLIEILSGPKGANGAKSALSLIHA